MRRIFLFTFFFFVFLLVISLPRKPMISKPPESKPTIVLPLYTNSRWIVDEGGKRVKLACVNWVSHLEPMVAEGLSKQPMDAISKKIVSMGFNCVRLTWPLFLVTNDSLASLTVRQSFQSLGLFESIAGILANNPSIIDLPLIKAYQAVVSSLGANNVLVILDNRISKPGSSDGNGFLGNQYFDPDLWMKGLTRMATIFNGVTNVVGMNLRNELQGSRKNVNDWYRYMEKAAEAVHSANPDVLVIISGLSNGNDLSFLRNQQVNLTFTRKLAYEVHWNGLSDAKAWESGNQNEVCKREVDNFMRLSGFLLDQGWPLLVSEFGMDLRGTNVNDNRYMNCFIGVVAELDLDWSLRTLVGSYYIIEGVIGFNEYYGVLDWNWYGNRNSSFLQRISALQSSVRGPGLPEDNLHNVIFHPVTGLCVLRESIYLPLKLGTCNKSEAWNYLPRRTLTLKGTDFCIQAFRLGEPAMLGYTCALSSYQWETISDSKMHLSSKVFNGSRACLDVDSKNTVVVNSCKCLSRDNMCDPGSQWFKLVDSTSSSYTSPALELDTAFAYPYRYRYTM
ncbi:glycosyl hydrolase 5 family protein-like [Castanea sativa]|uniref:glycosyl hydrolase 5 family protein-like n=1 Tax=Castanea sativa TaxID=21020 RepID=UPI003F652AD2